MCSTEKIVGFLDTLAFFLEPERVKAGLLWFEKGYVVYQFPNKALYQQKPARRLEVITELSSETPGTSAAPTRPGDGTWKDPSTG